MKSTVKLVILSMLIFSTTCDKPVIGYKYNQGSLPATPINLSDFNTEFDDYNSTAPSLGELIPFCFSTNRNSHGNEFDIIYQPMNVNFDKSSGELNITNEYANWEVKRDDYKIIKTAIKKIKTSGNEFGPNLRTGYNLNKLDFTLMYSSDIIGNAQIYFVSNITIKDFSEPKEIEFLNSEYEDMYPTFNSDKSKIYFCSNRDGGKFNFYSVIVNPEMDMESLLNDTSDYEILLDSLLSSSSDDKCPFIFDDKMVFASDRDGGFGGFDLYYSNFKNGEWSEPINFGEKINTESDEYRPILIDEGVSLTQTMMVFSSNRTGGLGGFDLYYVGIENE